MPRVLYTATVLPYLRDSTNSTSICSNATRSALLFEEVRTRLDPSLHETLDDLAAICDETRRQISQTKLHRWLHGWLLIHIPLSMALMVLMAVHAVMALYY